jgi:hypothetical protein
LPYKANADRRRHILKQRYRMTNWAEYDGALRQRSSLTVWFSEEAVAAWQAEPRTTRGGQPWYSALAITTALTPRAVFRLALRPTEGLIGSILQLLGLDLAVPDHSTLSRRAATPEVPQPRSSSGSKVELFRHAPTAPPLTTGDDLDRPAAHDLDDLTPDVKAVSLNGRQGPGKAVEAGRLPGGFSPGFWMTAGFA